MTLADVVRQMVEQALNSAVISSAGGDSPKKNYVMSVDINPVDFEGILEETQRNIINDIMEERELAIFQNKQQSTRQGDPAKDALQLITGNIGATPQSIVTRLVPLLGPAMLIFMLPEIVKFVVEYLIKPGGIFDVRFKREIQKEQFGFYSRQTQYDSSHGYRNVIIQGVNGFKAEQGSFHASTFRDIKEQGGLNVQNARIGLTDKALGFQGR